MGPRRRANLLESLLHDIANEALSPWSAIYSGRTEKVRKQNVEDVFDDIRKSTEEKGARSPRIM